MLDTSDDRPSGAPLFTIFTPTRNRAHTLHRGFHSLGAQTMRDFEWLVIDDGSTDDTDKLVAEWAKSADFPVRYMRQPHGGKHTAYNRAVMEARGRFFCCLDSDDALHPQALDTFASVWNSIAVNERHLFYAVQGLSCDQHGKIVGDRYPTEPFDADLREKIYVHRLRGERGTAALTEVLRRYPFSQITGSGYIPEGIVWLEIAKTFKIRGVNKVIRVYYTDDAEQGVTADRKGNLGAHALGRWHYYVWLLNNDFGYFFRSPAPFLKAGFMLPIVSWYSGQTLRRALAALRSPLAKLLVLSTLPFSAAVYAFGNLRGSRVTGRAANGA